MQFKIPAEHKNASGVYIIRNSVNAKVYVGSTKQFWQRLLRHRSALENNKHHSSTLQRHCNKHGLQTLEFCLLELVADASSLIAHEQKWIDCHKSHRKEIGFNICAVAGSRLGMAHKSETRAKISDARKGHVPTEKTRQRLAEGSRGKAMSDLTKQRLSEGRQQAKLLRAVAKAEALKSKQPYVRMPLSDEYKQKISASRKGQKPSAETRARMSEGQKARYKKTASL